MELILMARKLQEHEFVFCPFVLEIGRYMLNLSK